MADRPIDDQEKKPLDEESATPAAPESSTESGDGWHTPLAAGAEDWHAPESAAAAPAEPVPASELEDVDVLPGSWFTPTAPVPAPGAGYKDVAEGGWFVPASARSADLLAGVDRTIHPLPLAEAAPQEAAAPEKAAAPAPEEEPRLVDDWELAGEGELGAGILGTEEERELFARGDAAAIAAAMAARLAGEGEEEAPGEAAPEEARVEDSFFRQGEPGALTGVPGVPAPGVTAGLDRLVAQFDNVESQVGHLRDLYHQGQISRDTLQAELRKLMILDDQGTWWMIGVESNQWYRFADGKWVAAERPRAIASLGEIAAPTLEPHMQETQAAITLDEYNMPVVKPAPYTDPSATVVGPAAVQFDRLRSEQATVLSPAAQEGIPRPGQPDYAQAYTSAEQSDLYRRVQAEKARRQRSLLIRLSLAAVFGLLGLLFVLFVGSALFYISRVNRYSERIASLAEIAGEFQTTRIYDKDGNLLTQINDPTGGTRISTTLDQISPFLIHAVISTEDERFYQNPGWDPIAIMRAAIQNLQSGAVVSGASTITQQLARALVLEPERRTDISYGRKLDEAIIAAEIGRRYTKNEILELYLNEIYFGNLAYGAEAAAETYFNVTARELNLPQAALLAGLLQAPATYDPVINREAAFDRMDAVLAKMVQIGCLQFQHEPYASQGPFCVTRADLDAAVVQKAEVEIREYAPPTRTMRYPHFVNYVAQQLEENYGLADIYRAGFNVYTTLDPVLQDQAQQAVTSQLAALRAAGRGGNNASVVVMDPRDGRILAMVGSADYNNAEIDGKVNVAFTPQQPGSALKPILYVAALQGNAQGQYWTPATVIWDVPTCWGGYCPRNYDGAYHGPQSVRSALANSYNIPAVKTLDFVGVDRFAQTAQVMGLTFPGSSPQAAGLAGALGGFDVRLYDMVVAYATLANGGKRVEPYAITRILDNEGREVQIPPHAQPQQVIQPEHAYLITHILSDDVARSAAFGRNSVLNIPGYTVAVKTGTTNDNRDNWTLGYTPNVVVGVWHGNTDNSPMLGTSGLTGAAPIWNAVMTAAIARLGTQNFPIPPNVGTIEVCADSGTQPSAQCLNRRQELVVTSQLPPGPEQDIYKKVRVDTLTGLLANDFCPNFTEERQFLNISDPTAFDWINNTAAGQQWAAQRNIPLPARPVPTEACNPNIQQPIISMEWPVPNGQVQGVVEVQGRVLVYNFNRYQLEYGIGNAPQAFQIVDGPYTIQHANTEFLGRWDVSQLPNGPYTLRLKVFTNDGGFANLDRVVLVNNPIVTPTPSPSPTVMVITQTPTPIIITPTPFIETWAPPTFTPMFPTAVIVTNTPLPVPGSTTLPPRDPTFDIPVVYGAEATGVVNSVQVANYYWFDGTVGDIVQITAQTTAGDLDTLVYLMDSGGGILAENDDGSVGTDSELVYTLPYTGRFTIVVTRFDVGAGYTSGEYRMRLLKLN
ncbi:MAG: hypothetical protein HPY64_01120 [Anaerolineae bacterium]|nr:hypothetical protein [Anaerolineae bacterium]